LSNDSMILLTGRPPMNSKTRSGSLSTHLDSRFAWQPHSSFYGCARKCGVQSSSKGSSPSTQMVKTSLLWARPLRAIRRIDQSYRGRQPRLILIRFCSASMLDTRREPATATTMRRAGDCGRAATSNTPGNSREMRAFHGIVSLLRPRAPDLDS